MKILSTIAIFILSLNATFSFANTCDPTRVAFQTVKGIVAVEQVQGIVGIRSGGIAAATPGVKGFLAEVHYARTKDVYKILVTEADCRIFELKLITKNIAR